MTAVQPTLLTMGILNLREYERLEPMLRAELDADTTHLAQRYGAAFFEGRREELRADLSFFFGVELE